MPTLPSWLQPADPAGEYTRGVQIGAQIAESRARMSQQAQEFQMRADAQAKANQEEYDLQQQRIQVTKAYQQQQIALRKQQLDQVKAVNDAKTANAARQYAAQQQLQKRLQTIDADPSLAESQRNSARVRAIFDYGATTHLPGTEMTAMINASRPPKATVPASIDSSSNPDFTIVTQPNGTVSLHPKSSQKDGNVKVQLKEGDPLTTMSRSQAFSLMHSAPPGSFMDTNDINRSAFPPPSSPPSSPFGTLVPRTKPVAQPSDARVRVQDPNGKIGSIPRENLDKALQQGYTVVQDASGQ